MMKKKLLLIGLCLAPIAALVLIPNIKIDHHATIANQKQEANLEVQEFGEASAVAGSLGRKYYVDSAKGNDSNTGTTEAQAFKTIQQANQRVGAGDTIYVKNGTYNENVTIKASGKSNNWITFQAFPGHKPFVMGSQEAFKVQGNYIKIIGFEITSKAENGINIYKKEGVTHHVQILKNNIHDSGCNGIGGGKVDYLLIEGNTTYKNAFTAPWQCSGITLYQAFNFDDKPGFHNIIRGNVSYSNENKVLPSGGKEITDGNGIIIDDFRATQKRDEPQSKYRSATLVENNIVFDNGGRGIHVFQSDKVVVRNNTSFQNLKSKNLVGGFANNGEMNSSFSDGSSFYNNIVYAKDKSRVAFLDNNSNGNNKWDYNLSYKGIIKVGKDKSNAILGKNNLIDTDPLFINPSIVAGKANFRLKASSPAINSGTSISTALTDIEARKRPIGDKYDMGAYEMKF